MNERLSVTGGVTVRQSDPEAEWLKSLLPWDITEASLKKMYNLCMVFRRLKGTNEIMMEMLCLWGLRFRFIYLFAS